MEVAINDTDALPSNCIVSVRFGGVRRQAPLEKIKSATLKFPNTTDNCADPLKIEVLQTIASARLVLQRKEADYKVDLCGKGRKAMNIGVQVRHCPSAARETPVNSSPALPAKYQDAAVSAREYLERHGILRYVQGLLHTIIQVKPEDPFSFMIEQIAAALPVKPGCPPARTPSEADAQEKDLKSAAVDVSGSQLVIEQARQKTKLALTTAADSGKLADILGRRQAEQTSLAPTPKVRFQEVSLERQVVRMALVKAAENGQLTAALEGLEAASPPILPPLALPPMPPEEPPPDLLMDSDTSSKQAAPPQHPAVFAEDAVKQEARMKVKNVLLAASQDGRLDRALLLVRPDALETEAARFDPELHKVDLRQKAKNSLLAASANGSFPEVLKAAKEEKRQPRITPGDSLPSKLSLAASTGDEENQLQDTLVSFPSKPSVAPSTGDEDNHLQELRMQAQSILTAATADGRLASTLQCHVDIATANKKRAEVQGILVAASLDGSLFSALDSIEAEDRSVVDKLRGRVSAALLDASADGRLQNALASQISPRDATETSAKEPPPAIDDLQASPAIDELQEAKSKARAALANSMRSRASIELEEAPPSSELKEAKMQARYALSSALQKVVADADEVQPPVTNTRTAILTVTTEEEPPPMSHTRTAIYSAESAPESAPVRPVTPATNAEDIRMIQSAIAELRSENARLKEEMGGMHKEVDDLKRENAALSGMPKTTP